MPVNIGDISLLLWLGLAAVCFKNGKQYQMAVSDLCEGRGTIRTFVHLRLSSRQLSSDIAGAVEKTQHLQRFADGIIHNQISAANRKETHWLVSEVAPEMTEVRPFRQSLARVEDFRLKM
jgi:hypothetical protein